MRSHIIKFNYNISHTIPISAIPSQLSDTLSHINFNSSDTFRALTSLDTTKSMGIDKISPKVLKHCAIALHEPINQLFQLSLDKGYLPPEWKQHLIIPILKSGDRSLIVNYRPISLLPIISKLLEKLILDKITDFLSTSTINPTQFGFLKGKSTIQQMLTFTNDIMSIITSKGQVDTIYLDFRKAFDTVPHPELLSKLSNYGITGKLWQWLKEYLTNRWHCTAIDGSKSSFLPVTSGVPQGSILGPFLFILYLNDLPLTTKHSKILSFADDTKCYQVTRGISDVDHLQEDLYNIGTWSSNWKMSFNVNKFACIQFCNKEPTCANYTMNGISIPCSSQHKDLGIILTNNLSWGKHHEHILAKAYTKLSMVRRTFGPYTSIQTRKKLYTSLIQSQFLYGSQLWRPMFIKDIVTIEQLQRRASKFILQDYTSDYKSRLKSLHLLPLMMLLELNDIMFLVNNLKNPSNSFDISNYVSFSSTATRSGSLKLTHSRSISNSQRHFYFNRWTSLWNSLPPIDLTLGAPTIKVYF